MTAADRYQASTEALAAQTVRDVAALYADLLADQIEVPTVVLLIAARINRANASAVSLADVWLAVQIEEQTGVPTPTTGVTPTDDSERLVKAVNTVLRDTQPIAPANDAQSAQEQLAASNDGQPATVEPDAVQNRLERLARCEPLESAQRATYEAMQAQPMVQGWVRQMDADACQLCQWWWREGRVWPREHPMPRHKGCTCVPRIVAAQNIEPTGFTRRLNR